MIIVIESSKTFNNYGVFMRMMMVAMTPLRSGDTAYVYSVGPASLNSMATGFVNLTEDSLKSRGIRLRMSTRPSSWVKENISSVDYYGYMCNPKEHTSNLTKFAESKDVEVGIFKY